MASVLIGGGGHASDVLAVFEALGRKVVGFQDDGEPDMRRFAGRAEHIGRVGDPSVATHYTVGIGWPGPRRRVAERLSHLIPETVIHPDATVYPFVRIGRGTVIMAGARVSAGAVIGEHALIHHNAVIGHDCIVGDFVSVMPGAVVSGDVSLDDGCLIGCSASIRQGVTVGSGAVVGMGSVVLRDVKAGQTVLGCPAEVRSL